jgi:hypothetical protein
MDHQEKLMLFGQFVGTWAFDGWLEPEDGTREEFSGEWRFDWALDGMGRSRTS